VENLVKEYPRQSVTKTLGQFFKREPAADDAPFRAVDGISFSLARGSSLGLVGESCCSSRPP
jgi:peptide/nickel transport system ATP-binding protein